MPKKRSVTQELVNIYPKWSRTRNDQSSVGYRLLNSFSLPLDYMEKSLEKQKKNIYLTTANLDEIDTVYKVSLPKEFEFGTDNKDPLEICYLPPTVSGLHLGTWYPVTLATNNTIDQFWYNSLPSRWSVSETIVDQDDYLLSILAEEKSVSGIWKHHLADTARNGGKIWVEAIGGTEYIKVADDNTVERGRIKLTGKTRQGTFDEETLVFAWDSMQSSQKEWEQLTNVDILDIPSGVQIDIRSSSINAGPYMDFWNTSFSTNRNKVDTFWDLEFIEGQPILSKIGYITDEWQQLILGFSNKETKDRWELLDKGMSAVSGVDIAIKPFTDQAWLITENAKLYCYDLVSDMPENLNLLQDITPGSHVSIEIESPYVIFGEDIEFTPWHARPLQRLKKYTVSYRTPSGTVTQLANEIVSANTQLSREIGGTLSFTPAERGTYILTLQATFIDNTVHTYKTPVVVQYKQSLNEYDLSTLITDPVEGIEFDTDQKLTIKTTVGDFYCMTDHKDIMLIDYKKKILYFHVPYEEVDVGED
jgi:hypothetical protein